MFLGINLKCASCHDSFVSRWKLADAYALASVFTDEPLEIFRCDKATGKFAQRRSVSRTRAARRAGRPAGAANELAASMVAPG